MSFIEEGGDMPSHDIKKGDYPLRRAALKGHTEMVKALLKGGADVNARDNEAGRSQTRAEYGYADLRVVTLEGAVPLRMPRGEWADADLRGANLTDAELRGAESAAEPQRPAVREQEKILPRITP